MVVSRQSDRSGAGRHNDGVAGDFLTVIEPNDAGVDVETRGASMTPVEIELPQSVIGQEREPIGFPFAGEKLLRQRRPIVGGVGLGRDDRDPTGIAVPSQCSGAARAGQ
jgi:hypothetical protein